MSNAQNLRAQVKIRKGQAARYRKARKYALEAKMNNADNDLERQARELEA